MLELLAEMSPQVVSARATGEITKEDFESVLLPAFNNAAKNYGEIYFLLVIDTEISNFTLGAWWADLKTGIDHFTKWKKIAIVTDSSGIERFSDFFNVLTPGSSKGYKIQEL